MRAQPTKIRSLELHRETIQDLTEREAEDAAGGQVYQPRGTRPQVRTERCTRVGAECTYGTTTTPTVICTLGTQCPDSLDCILTLIP
jgi:hypothetical protein